ncbi:MAG: GTP-binding protein, partial [Syntrophales bacterium]
MNIRNFCIIAHIDHGKSTLSDRMMEITGTLEKRELKEQHLDSMDLERERGITIKLTPVRMNFKGVELNLIDTPGHTDFRYEVSRSLAACEGAILLIDASQGIQAQTLAVLYMAMEHNLAIIPVLNKIDLPAADPERVTGEVIKMIGCKKEDILRISAKDGTGVKEVLDAVIKRIPEPKEVLSLKLQASSGEVSRALIFDAVMDEYRGVVIYVRAMEGAFKKGMQVYLLGSKVRFEVQDVGYFNPKYISDDVLTEGQIGYIVTGLKKVAEARVGDTVSSKEVADALPGYKKVQPMVFAGLYPTQADDYPKLRDSLEKLSLNDAAIDISYEHNTALGNG